MDVTSQFCSKLFSPGSEDYDVSTRVLTPENINKLRSTSEIRGNQEAETALLSRAQQYVFCGQFDEALNDLHLWPEASRDEMKRNFAASIKSYRPGFAARLAGPSDSKTAPVVSR